MAGSGSPLDRSQATYRGFLISDPRFSSLSLWDAESQITQAGPRPGVPVPQQDSELVLQATGTQEADSQLRIHALRGGHPVAGGGGYTWYKEGEARERGWDIPTVITSWETVVWTDGTGSITATRTPQTITLSNDVVLVAYERDGVAGTSVIVSARAASDGAITGVVLETQTAAPTFGFHPCMLQLPNGRVLCFYWTEDTTFDQNQIRMQFSDDDGATWSVGQRFCLKVPVDTDPADLTHFAPGRLRVAYKDGQVLLLAHKVSNDTASTYLDRLFQYASVDLGATFSLIEQVNDDSADPGIEHDIVVAGGLFIISSIGGSSVGATRPAVRRIANAFEPASSVDVVAPFDDFQFAVVSGATPFSITVPNLCMWRDEDDVLYIAGIKQVTSPVGAGVIMRSLDQGLTWVGMGQGIPVSGSVEISPFWDSQDSATHPRDLTATAQRGRTLMSHNWRAAPGSEDDSLGIMYLGGYSTTTMPGFNAFDIDTARVSWATTWLPFDLPGNCGWTAAGAGTEALVSPGELELTTAIQSIDYSRTPVGTIAAGVIDRFVVRVAVGGGGSTASDDIARRVRLADGTADYDVSIRFDAAGTIRVFDNNAGALVGDISIGTTQKIDFKVAMNDGNLATWYRVYSNDSDREWIVGPSSSGLTNDTGTPEPDNLVQWGHIAIATAHSFWTEFHFVTDEEVGQGLATGQTNPDDLFPRTFSALPMSVDGGVKIQAIDGPAFRDEQWNIDTRYDSAIERIFPSEERSPRRGWKSTGTTEQRIPISFNPGLLGFVCVPGIPIVGFGLYGINWRTGRIEGDTGGGSWVTVATIDAAENQATMEYSRIGDSVVPTVSPTDQPFLSMSEAAGYTFQLDATTFRRVNWHREGKWEDGFDGPRLQFHLDGITGAEPGTGTGRLWANNVVVVANINVSTYSGFRLVIDSQGTADGDLRLGSMVAGPVIPFGQDYSWGRVIDTEMGFTRTEAQDRTSALRETAPARRAVEFGWTDGIDVSDVFHTNPDFIQLSEGVSNGSAGTRYGTPMTVESTVRLLNGQPCVYLARIPKAGTGATQAFTFNRRDEHVYGYIEQGIRLENVQGNELQSPGEVLRVASLRFLEEV